MKGKNKEIKTNKVAWLVFLVILAISFGLFLNYRRDSSGDDIHYVWQEGARILAGQNPYERILRGNMRDDNYYPIYFPLFYLLCFISQALGLRNFSEWMLYWRPVCILFDLGIAWLFFQAALRRKKGLILAFWLAFFWLFNRWTLHGVVAGYMDFMPIFFLTLSLLIFSKNQPASFGFLGLSLALKQMAIFLVPVYLIKFGHFKKKAKLKNFLWAGFLILTIPLIVSLPFLLKAPEGFTRSILFSATRSAINIFDAPSLDSILTLEGFKARLPMFFLMSLVYLAVLKKKLSLFQGVFLTMLSFTCFNSVLYGQHFSWLLSLLPLLFLEENIIKVKKNEN